MLRFDPSRTAEDSANRPVPDEAGSKLSAGRLDAQLFGEAHARVVVTCAGVHGTKVVERAKLSGVPARLLGRVGGTVLRIKLGSEEWGWEVAELHDLWWNAIARAMAAD
jgi:hypothetical protein